MNREKEPKMKNGKPTKLHPWKNSSPLSIPRGTIEAKDKLPVFARMGLRIVG